MSNVIAQPDLHKTTKKAEKYLNRLTKALLTTEGDRPPQEVIDSLSVPVCLLAKILVPDIRQKLDEILFSHQNPELKVNPHQHGADLINAETGSATELKVATCILNPRKVADKNGNLKTPVIKAAVMWPIPRYEKGKEEARRKKLLESIKKKTDSGGAVIRVVNGMQKVLAEYHLSHEFLMGYFEKVGLGISNTYNMGCPMCPTCKRFHRLEKLQNASNKMPLDDQGWKAVFEKSKINCGKKNAGA